MIDSCGSYLPWRVHEMCLAHACLVVKGQNPGATSQNPKEDAESEPCDTVESEPNKVRVGTRVCDTCECARGMFFLNVSGACFFFLVKVKA